MNKRWLLGIAGLTFCGLTAFELVQPGYDRVLIRLPGTQPGQVAYADSFQVCAPCHQSETGPRITNLVRDWSGSTMAHAPRDPIFNALLAITTKRTISLGLDVAEFCLRCHSPSGWLEGRSHELSVQALYGTDLDGVHCDFCHRATNPLAPDPGASISGVVPGYGNGMYVVMPFSEPRRGSRGVTTAAHPTFQDPFLKTSEFCGVCHEVSNPYLSPNPATTAPHLQIPIERTYSEWKLSWYATRGAEGTCQACHMPRRVGYSSSMEGTRLRLDIAQHDFTGANTFVPDILQRFWTGLDSVALREARERAQSMLSRAARLEVAAGRSGNSVVALVRVTNRTGHKLFTGFPEGRRIWIHVVGKDDRGNVLFESGKIDRTTRQLIRDSQIKVYEIKPGLSPALAAALGMPAGPSFHAALNDTIYFDNRIPPRGFRYEEFRVRRAEPVGYVYQDGQYWDESHYVLPDGVRSVEVSLLYQLVTKEFVEFLRDENVNNPYDWNNWGQRLYEAWLDKGDPVVMASSTVQVKNTPPRLRPFQDEEFPVEFILAQNYPNPFNTGTTIEFWISSSANVNLSVYDITGRKVATLSDGELPSGVHTKFLESSGLASGVYFYRLMVGMASDTKRMLLIK